MASPNDKATGRQLWALNRAGLLELRTEPGKRVTWGEAGRVIGELASTEHAAASTEHARSEESDTPVSEQPPGP